MLHLSSIVRFTKLPMTVITLIVLVAIRSIQIWTGLTEYLQIHQYYNIYSRIVVRNRHWFLFSTIFYPFSFLQIISYDSPRGGVSVITEKGETTTSFLLIQSARPQDSGQYQCNPSNAKSKSVTVHVLNGKYVIHFCLFENNPSPFPPQCSVSTNLVILCHIYTSKLIWKLICLSVMHKCRISQDKWYSIETIMVMIIYFIMIYNDKIGHIFHLNILIVTYLTMTQVTGLEVCFFSKMSVKIAWIE